MPGLLALAFACHLEVHKLLKSEKEEGGVDTLCIVPVPACSQPQFPAHWWRGQQPIVLLVHCGCGASNSPSENVPQAHREGREGMQERKTHLLELFSCEGLDGGRLAPVVPQRLLHLVLQPRLAERAACVHLRRNGPSCHDGVYEFL